MDGDLQDDPREIPKLLEALDSGFDLVTGWRHHRRDTLSKRISSVCFNSTVSLLTGVHLHDMNCGLKACRADVARELKLYGELHRFVPVLASQKGYRVGEVEVNHRPREHGRSKYGWKRAISALFDIQMVVFLTRYLNRPLRLFGSVGLLLAAAGVALGLYLSVLHLLGESIGRRPLLALAGLLILTGIQLVSVGLNGMAFALLASAAVQPPQAEWPAFASAYCLAYVVGYVSFLTPSGIGVREAALASMLSLYLPVPTTVTLSLLARLISTAGEGAAVLAVGLPLAGGKVGRNQPQKS